MTDNITLADADSIELEGFYDASYAQDWAEPAEHIDIDRWSKYGHDRLYINSGIPKADKYDLYVDLQTHEIVSNNESKHSGGDVEIAGDTATIIIEESGDKEHEITVSLAGDSFETANNEDDEDSDDEPEAEDNDTLSAPSDNASPPVADGGGEAADDDEPMLVRETREVSVGSFGATRDRDAWVPDDRGSWTERDELKYEALRTVTRSEYATIPLADDRDRVPLRGHFSDRLESDPLFERHWLRMQVREEIEDVDAYVDDHLTFETVDRGESGEGEGHEVYAIVDVTDEQMDETARFRCRNAVDIGYQVFAVDDDVSDRLEALGEIALTTYKPIKGGHRQFDWE
jgi:hypothetical protein